MWPDRLSNPGPLTYESGALPTALCSPVTFKRNNFFPLEANAFYCKDPSFKGFSPCRTARSKMKPAELHLPQQKFKGILCHTKHFFSLPVRKYRAIDVTLTSTGEWALASHF